MFYSSERVWVIGAGFLAYEFDVVIVNKPLFNVRFISLSDLVIHIVHGPCNEIDISAFQIVKPFVNKVSSIKNNHAIR